MSLVRDILQQRNSLFYVEEGDSVAAVVRRMAELNLGAIMVMGGGELRGVFSERDLMRRVVLEGRDPERTAVHQVMTTSVADHRRYGNRGAGDGGHGIARLPPPAGDARRSGGRVSFHARRDPP